MVTEKPIDFFEIFPWDEKFEGGIVEIDNQHKKLVFILNQLAAHLANLSTDITLNNTFNELAGYADYHFSTEEKIWKQYLDNDDSYESHKKVHSTFINNVVSLRQNTDGRPLDDVIRDIVSFLAKWLAQHILDSDKRMSLTVQAIQSGLSIEDAKARANEEMSGVMRLLIDTVLKMYDTLSNRTMDLMQEKARRKQVENANQSLEEKVKQRTAELQDLYDNAPTGYHSLDGNGIFLMMNVTELRWLGYTREEVIGIKKFTDLITEEGAIKFAENFQQFKINGHVENQEYDLVRKDGSTFPVIINEIAVLDSKDSYLQSRSTVFDNTERKANEAEIRRVNSLSDTALELARAGYWYIPLDESGYYSLSDRVISIHGDEYHDDHRYHLKTEWLANLEAADPELAQAADESLKSVIEGTSDHFDAVYPYRRPADGGIIWMHASGDVVKNASGKRVSISGVSQDITQQKKMEGELNKAREAAESANKAKSIFLANMSHEIRTPMNAILGFAQILLNDPSIDGKPRDYIGTILRSGEHLLMIINDILEMSKIEAGQITFNPVTFSLPLLLTDIKNMFHAPMEAKNLKMDLELAPDLCKYINTDENKLREILINLVGNAAKFTRKGGIILRCWTIEGTSGVESQNLRVMIDVEDTGMGILPEDFPRLFKAFEQTRSGAHIIGGTGLGLTISQSFARLMGGEITVDSTPDIGSCFHVVITAQKIEDDLWVADAPSHRIKGLKAGTREIKVLIVDDHEQNRMVLNEMLQAVGLSTQCTSNGAEAIEAVEAWKPDIVLMDLRMPVMDGYEASRRIKSQFIGELHIIAVTASVIDIERDKLQEYGMVDFLSKPFRENVLFALLEKYLGNIFDHIDQDAKEIAPDLSGINSLEEEILENIPAEVLIKLKQATQSAQQDVLFNLLEEVSAHSPEIARRLRVLADNYEYDLLLKLFE